MAHVQTTGIQSVGSVASVSKAFTSNVTAGNVIAVGGVTTGADMPAGVVTDTLSNSYTRANIVDHAPGTVTGASFYSEKIAGGACTVTLDATGSDFQSIAMTEFSARLRASALDGQNTGQGTDAAPVSGSFTTAGVGADIFAVFSHDGTATGLTSGAGFSTGFEDEDATEMPIHAEYRENAGPGSKTATGVLGATKNWVIAAAAFREDWQANYNQFPHIPMRGQARPA